MPKYDPRYVYPRGYEYGNVALGLADLLGQGFDRMHRWDQDAQGQTNRDQEYLLKLQQFMQQNEDRDLDRQIKTDALGLSREARAQTAADRASASATAASGRSGLAKLLKMPSTVEEESAPPPEFAADPERLQPNILQALIKRPSTRDDAMSGLSPAEAGNKDVADLMLKLYPQKEPKAPEPYNLPKGTQRRGTNNELLADNPEEIKPEKPLAPSREQTLLNAARAELTRTLKRTPTDDEVFERAELIREKQAKAGASTMTFGSAGERKDDVQRSALLDLVTSLETDAKAHPEFFGGPLGAKGVGQRSAERIGMASPEFSRFRANNDKLKAELINALAGAAIGPAEAENYLASVPRISGQGPFGVLGNSTQEYQANINATRQNIENLQRHARDLATKGLKPGATGAPPPPPPAQPLGVLSEAGAAYSKKWGY